MTEAVLRAAPSGSGTSQDLATPSAMAPVPYRVRSKVVENADSVTLCLDPVDAVLTSPAPGEFMMLHAFGIGEIAISVSGDPSVAEVPALEAPEQFPVRGKSVQQEMLLVRILPAQDRDPLPVLECRDETSVDECHAGGSRHPVIGVGAHSTGASPIRRPTTPAA